MTENLRKPKDINAYKKWLSESHNIELNDRVKRYYEAVMAKATSDIEKSPIWESLKSNFNRTNQAYFLKTNYPLFVSNEIPKLMTKPFESVVEKSFRKNVLDNRNWPEAPDKGWVFPDKWYGQINDLIRTCFVVKYLDGVNFLAKEFEGKANENGYINRTYLEAREEGYYAAHFYFQFPCEIPKEDWDTKEEIISIELQITTQLQEVIRRLLHEYYETKRSTAKKSNTKWQWDYKSDEFSANYLGHILHYVEGMIMDLRDNRLDRGEEK
jgi:hypothetical protein